MAVSTRWNLLAGTCAAMLALTGCGDSGSKKNEADAGGADANGGNANAGENTGDQVEGGMTAMPVADLDDNVAGKGCKSSADCDGDNATCASTIGGFAIGGMMIGSQPAEGGYCTGPCDDNSNCGAGGVCAGGFAGQGTCQKACSGDADCRGSEGYFCKDNSITIPEGGLPMLGDAGVPGGMMPMIPPQPNTCLPKAATDDLADGVVGKPCAANGECTGGTCSTTVMVGGFMGMGGMTVTYPGGYCSGACEKNENCGPTGVCLGAFSFGPISGLGTCALGCKTTAECGRAGYRCVARQGGAPGAGPQPKACQPGMPPKAGATLTAFAGSLAGTATFSTTATGAQLEVTLNNCVDGTVYAVRIHDGPACGSYGGVWDTARGTIAETITCAGSTGTFTMPVARASSEAATKWSLDEAPATDVVNNTLLVYPSPIVDPTTAPLACGAIAYAP